MLFRSLFHPANRWTLVDISHDPEVVIRAKLVHVMAEGQIIESGLTQKLLREDSELAQLFPTIGLKKV